jgi:hypothetical protein
LVILLLCCLFVRALLATLVLAPLAALGSAAARDARSQFILFAAYLTAIPLLSPISEMHHLTMLVGTLGVWLLAAGSGPFMPAFDGVAAVLFVPLHWLGNAWSRSRPALVLLVRAWVACRPSEDTV